MKRFYLIFGGLVSIGMLSACATPFKDYEGTSKRVVLANICEREGLISKEAFSSYSSYQFGTYARQWTVDDQKLRDMYFSEVERSSGWKPNTPSEKEQLKLACAEVSTVAERVRPSSAAQQRTNEYNYTPPKTTNCMTTLGWTRCTTN